MTKRDSFSPATPAIALEVKQLADAYNQDRRVLLAVLTSSRRRSLKDFSDWIVLILSGIADKNRRRRV